MRDGDKVVGLRLSGKVFQAELESGEVIVPKRFLTGFRLSDIPDELVVKPVEAIEGNVIHLEHDILISAFRDGVAVARVEDMGRRKLWDGEVGFAKFMEAMRQAIRERHAAMSDLEETDFQDDGDYIFIWYEVRISEDFPIEQAVGHIEGVILKLEKRRDRILERRTDSLLGIYNKATFEIDLLYALEMAQATRRQLALIFVDIDHFKRINDSLGHQTGDAVLSGVGQVLAARTQGKGEPYRWGGEELAVLLAGTGPVEARQVAEEIRRAVADTAFEAGVRVTVSCGVASYPANGTTPTALVGATDAALYEAKQAGRNVVKVAGG